jgi:aspartate/methionine/tyrosine aminotransferase
MLVSHDDVGALVVSSPANPVGNLYREQTMKELIGLAVEKDFWFISDEIYHGLVYDTQEHTALEYSDRTIVINSFSKYFCMPGFRLGWMILPEELVRKAEIIVQNIFIAANTPAQYAALEAFDSEYLQHVRNTFRQRRNFLYNELKDIFQIDTVPDGAFYIWANISRYSNDAVKFCQQLLDKKSVAVTPGIDFGKNMTGHYIRFAYTQEISQLRTGIERIREFLKKG